LEELLDERSVVNVDWLAIYGRGKSHREAFFESRLRDGFPVSMARLPTV